MLEYKKGGYLSHSSPCFLVAKLGSTALRLVVDYNELNKQTENRSRSLPNMEHTLEHISSCRYKTNSMRWGMLAWPLDVQTCVWMCSCRSMLIDTHKAGPTATIKCGASRRVGNFVALPRVAVFVER